MCPFTSLWQCGESKTIVLFTVPSHINIGRGQGLHMMLFNKCVNVLLSRGQKCSELYVYNFGDIIILYKDTAVYFRCPCIAL